RAAWRTTNNHSSLDTRSTQHSRCWLQDGCPSMAMRMKLMEVTGGREPYLMRSLILRGLVRRLRFLQSIVIARC
ncbi:hypothetical protein BGZ95_006194, partial [Linnemannia exigua]